MYFEKDLNSCYLDIISTKQIKFLLFLYKLSKQINIYIRQIEQICRQLLKFNCSEKYSKSDLIRFFLVRSIYLYKRDLNLKFEIYNLYNWLDLARRHSEYLNYLTIRILLINNSFDTTIYLFFCLNYKRDWR